MRYVPRHLPNKLEYKVLSCISVHYQSRMASNGSAITPPYPLTVQAGQYEESFYTSRSILVLYLGMLWRGGWMVAGKGVRCMQCLCWGFVLGRRGRLSRRSSIQVDEISCIRDHPRSSLSELQVMIPKVDRNGRGRVRCRIVLLRRVA